MEHSLAINKLNGHDATGKIGKVFFKIGDNIKVNDIIFTIESGRGSLKYKSLYNGVLKVLNIQTGDNG